jgi:ABC-type nitrate/sulfonate/bicarbonate transport system permease component
MSSARARTWAVGALSSIAALALWQVLAASHVLVDGDELPTVTATFDALVELLQASDFWTAVWRTTEAAFGGFLIATLIGVPLGFAIGLSEVASRSTHVLIEFLKPIPAVVIIPLLLLTVGPSQRMALFLVTYGCLWPILVQTVYGVRDVDPVTLDTARSMRLSRAQRMLRVVLPSTTPFIVTGMRISAGAALVIAVVAGLIGGAPGIGQEIGLAQGAGQFPRTYALVLVTGVLGLGLYLLIGRLERRALRWHSSVRTEVLL